MYKFPLPHLRRNIRTIVEEFVTCVMELVDKEFQFLVLLMYISIVPNVTKQ